MGWFDEQIRQRKHSDQEMFEESFVRLAGAVLGKRAMEQMEEDYIVSSHALDDILRYFHYKPSPNPPSAMGIEEQIEYAMRPHGIMYRIIDLEDSWYKDSFGPILAFEEESGKAVALLPKGLSGYRFNDLTTGKKATVNSRNASRFMKKGVVFYRPFPQKKLSMKDLLLYIRGTLGHGDRILVGVAALAVAIVNTLVPKLTWILTGPVLNRSNSGILNGIAVFIVCVIISTHLFTAIRNLVTNRIKIKSDISIRSAVMMRILSMPSSFFRKHSAGELSSRAESVSGVCNMIVNIILSTGLTAVMFVIYLTQVIDFAPVLVVPAVVVIVCTTTVSFLSVKKQADILRNKIELSAKQLGLSYSMISGIEKIRLTGSEKRIFARWASLYAKEAEYEYNPPLFLKINGVISTAITLFGTVVLYYFAAYSGVEASQYIAFNMAYGMAMGAFSSLSDVALSIGQIQPLLEMANPLLNEEPEVPENAEIVTNVSGKIDVDHLYFRYNEQAPYVVRDLSFKIRPGEYIAIVGTTGCGKSTLMRLLLGFEKPEKGSIFYDGKDMSKLDLRSLRSKMGAVVQNGKLMAGSIYDNIMLSTSSPSIEKAWKAAATAAVADDIMQMPMGMNTLVSENQSGFSGGQKQRILIARALAPEPSILFFDEATSALDNKNQKNVSEAIDELKCTRIVIAHRLTTIKKCDRILVMNEGQIVEEGSYEQLIKKKGLFKELVERQRVDNETDN